MAEAPSGWARVADLAFAGSLASWGVGLVLGLGRGEVASIPLPVRLAMAAVHLTAAGLFLTRAPVSEHGTLRSLFAALPSLVISGVAFRMGGAQLAGPWLALFVAGALGTCASLLALGRSFAIFAARRALVLRGPYRLVRHPAYACELAMMIATAGAGASGEPVLGVPRGLVAAAVIVLAVAFLALRAREEERFLASDAAYAAYMERVRYRLLPLLW